VSQLLCPTSPIHTTTLPSGLQVVYQYVPAPVVAMDFWVRAGAAAEPECYNGLAHALEHMVFRGSHDFPAGAFDHLIEKHGVGKTGSCQSAQGTCQSPKQRSTQSRTRWGSTRPQILTTVWAGQKYRWW